MSLYPAYVRPRQGRVVAGVAAGLANHLGVDVFHVRIALLLSSLFAGVGVFFYAGVWMLSKVSDSEPAPTEKLNVPRSVYYVLVLCALAGSSFSTGESWLVFIPVLIVAVGAIIAWQAYDRGFESRGAVLNVTLGGMLVLAGVLVTLVSINAQNAVMMAFLAVGLSLAGIGILVVPLVLKLWRSLTEEKAAKAASEERAEIASRLHDSVLQTLALIQKKAADPDEVVRLARGQERELRGWLFEPEEKTKQTVFTAVERAAGEVEDLFGMRIVPVTVGEDVSLTESSQAAVLAAREAMVNAAKHAEVSTVDVYAEILAGELSIFVRDRGVGFDPEQTADDRHGIKDSIVARMERAGGSSSIKSASGEGTEVCVSLTL